MTCPHPAAGPQASAAVAQGELRVSGTHAWHLGNEQRAAHRVSQQHQLDTRDGAGHCLALPLCHPTQLWLLRRSCTHRGLSALGMIMSARSRGLRVNDSVPVRKETSPCSCKSCSARAYEQVCHLFCWSSTPLNTAATFACRKLYSGSNNGCSASAVCGSPQRESVHATGAARC